MTSPVKQYRLFALAAGLVALDLALIFCPAFHRLSPRTAFATMAGLDLLVTAAWLVIVTLAAKRQNRQAEPRLEYDKDSYWARTGANKK